MNIFEQYGIQEVADCTLYSIELDENDDEIYVPIMYFDTLKISTLEGTAEQVSARGGLGNPELIVWDYGKEITVTLQDALYTPASQSLTWGGQYKAKNFELYGTFTNYVYPKDKYGRTLYYDEKGGTNTHTEEKENAKIIIDSYKNFKLGGIDLNDPSFYIWEGCTIKMISDLSRDVYIRDNITITYIISTKRYRLEDTSHTSGSDIIYFSKRIKDKESETYYESVSTGTFILDAEDEDKTYDRNEGVVPPQDLIYPISSGLENVYYLDRMEKCRATQTFVINTDANMLHHNYSMMQEYSQCPLTVYFDPKTMKPFEPNTTEFYRKNGEIITGNLRVIKQYEIYYKWTRSQAKDYTSLGDQIIIDAVHFPGTYRLVGETYARSRKTGKDHRYQFEIPLCKMSSETSLTLEAGGEPTTFDMSLKVLRREDGTMMKLTQYSVENNKYDGYKSDSTVITPIDEVVYEFPTTDEDD